MKPFKRRLMQNYLLEKNDDSDVLSSEINNSFEKTDKNTFSSPPLPPSSNPVHANSSPTSPSSNSVLLHSSPPNLSLQEKIDFLESSIKNMDTENKKLISKNSKLSKEKEFYEKYFFDINEKNKKLEKKCKKLKMENKSLLSQLDSSKSDSIPFDSYPQKSPQIPSLQPTPTNNFPPSDNKHPFPSNLPSRFAFQYPSHYGQALHMGTNFQQISNKSPNNNNGIFTPKEPFPNNNKNNSNNNNEK